MSEGRVRQRNRGFRCAVVQTMRAAGRFSYVGHLGILLCESRFLVQEKSYHFGWGCLQAGAMNLPFLFEVSSIHERLLGSHFSRGQSRIEIRSRERFFFRETFAEKNGEAADEGIAGSSC